MIMIMIAVGVIFTVAVVMVVIASATLRLGHACQHARARPLQHIDKDQPIAPAQQTQLRGRPPRRQNGRSFTGNTKKCH